ncbi:MAG: DUF2147 domain-containing protein [Bacteroidales bacterium]|nr:DUF2147 domain-containing protein [Bacteroidales bacterium]
MRVKTMLFFLSLIIAVPAMNLQAQHKSNDVIGLWLTEDKDAQVEIFQREGKFYGKITWLKEPIDEETGKPKTDKKNPDPKLRSLPTLGMEMLKGFSFDGKNEWSGGEIYDAGNGKTYRSYMSLEGKDKLKIRGYIGISLLGRNTYWTRVQ